MKTLRNYILLLGITFLIAACKKEKQIGVPASVSVVNASVDAGTLKVNYFGSPINWGSYIGTDGQVNYGANKIYTIKDAKSSFPFYIVPANDTLKNVMNGTLDLKPNGIYSLYTAGQSPGFETIFKEEKDIPYNFGDSAVAVRFINLSPNSPAVNVTMASSPDVNETAGLNYKQITGFRYYPMKKVVPAGSLTFQVRVANSNAIVAAYTIPSSPVSPYSTVSTILSRFRGITLVIKGLYGTTTGTNAFSVFPVPLY